MSGWDTAAPADDAAIATESNDNDPMDTGGHDANGADGGALNSGFDANGAGGGDHRVAECTEPDTRPCHNCGEVGHQKSECTAPRKPREGETCRRCESTEHVFKDCPLKDTPKEGQVCYDCGSNEHFPRDCPTRRHDERQKASAEELHTLWEKVVVADRSGDFDDVKQALLSYIKNDPDLTWPELEEKLRTENLKTHIIAEGPRVLPPSKELADNQRQGNKMYEAIFVRNARVLRQKLRTKNENEEEAINQNKEHLKDAGLIRERLREDGKYHVPEWAMSRLTTEQQYMAQNKCLRCGEDDHKTKDCKKEKEVDEKKQQKCFKGTTTVTVLILTRKTRASAVKAMDTMPRIASCRTLVIFRADAVDRKVIRHRTAPKRTLALPWSAADASKRVTGRPTAPNPTRALATTVESLDTSPRNARSLECAGHRSDACPNAPAGDDNETNAAVAMATDIPAEDLPSGASGSGW
ncbi:hypothetical protein PhCBS80983_g03575 [Powellomyces hirtus]|uniref:CCHC-type domain-containing protein n=1 Tax=Powellomyces hirtus TaxID=109895 RepID=A0A507E1Z8_9FUNG|nr:hypothetical protein PhCBS80983_g03575 [Powellomyces hirtus]